MVNRLVTQALGRIGGVVLLFGLLWLGLARPPEHKINGRSVRTGPLLVIILGFILLGIGFGIVDFHSAG